MHNKIINENRNERVCQVASVGKERRGATKKRNIDKRERQIRGMNAQIFEDNKYNWSDSEPDS